MIKGDSTYKNYIQILKEELIPAMGCTEPIAVAYCAAVAREHLGSVPDRATVEVSGNIIKNVKSVVVPNTGRMRGIETAVAVGVLAGDASRELEVISGISISPDEIREYLNKNPITVKLADSHYIFDIMVTLYKGTSYSKARILNYHTNIALIEKDGEILLYKEVEDDIKTDLTDRSILNVKDIVEFADILDVDDIKEVIGRQIKYNYAIAEEGIKNDYGANIGSSLLEKYGEDILTRAKAMAAAGSDARMSGCELPVVINSGSGNQGLTASVPVIVFAKGIGASDDKLYRALAVSNLITIHQKTSIGRLSAFCGVISAGAGASCGIAYLLDGSYDVIKHTLVNALAIVSGIVCDGAKPSCAGKIAMAIDAGMLGYNMYKNNQQFIGGDGIVKGDVESTIRSVGRLGGKGMRETDKEILSIMISD
ncbi:MAG: serine dehydratase subunit alpha family protein [Acetivibrionales bacterium]